jgi:protein phosphatase
MKVAYKSDVGKKRENNEDRILVDEDRGIFLLADGMGGHKAGEVASRLAVEEAYACLKDRIDQTNDEKGTSKLLIEALFNAHDAIKEKAKADLNLMGMGTTLVEMILKAEKAHICHVGDSRVYLLREGAKQLTKDQTVGDYLVEHNIMRREEVPPQKWHTLTQAVGVSENIVPELKHVEIKPGDLLLLCSDGLTDMLSDEEIEKIIQKHRDDMDAGVEALVKGANNKGGKDNISVILVKWE